MSYILDALRKSDQQRQRSSAPSLQAVPLTPATRSHPSMTLIFGAVALLIVSGFVAGLLLTAGQGSSQPQPTSAPTPVPSALSVTLEPIPQVIERPAVSQTATTPSSQAQISILPFAELPVAIQSEIPEISVQMHVYSPVPAERLVSINSIRLREGGYLMSGLRLDQITPDGIIFSYKDYRFKRTIE